MPKTGISKAKMISVGALCVALAFVLNQITIYRMPMGGSVTPGSMLFIVLAGYWLGPFFGIAAGIAAGLLDMATGFYAVHPAQVAMDYLLAFGMLGTAGFFRKMKFGLQIGYVAGVFGRFVMVFLSGAIFFSEYAPEGQNFIAYSAIYNASYIVPEMLVTLVIISLPVMKNAIDVVTKSVLGNN
ncbi:MAG: energy-coupled thiamine transporter ThiT [Defluviitaleaceae bacterium]|nr:energy-coupled thiamine transporter ThiT [Defluviitaleaceae bacterium]